MLLAQTSQDRNRNLPPQTRAYTKINARHDFLHHVDASRSTHASAGWQTLTGGEEICSSAIFKHARRHTHTHTLSLSPSVTDAHARTHTLFLSLSLSLTHTHTLTRVRSTHRHTRARSHIHIVSERERANHLSLHTHSKQIGFCMLPGGNSSLNSDISA